MKDEKKSHKGMLKVIGLLAFLGISITIFIWYWQGQNNIKQIDGPECRNVDQKIDQYIDPVIKDTADKYIISLVGEREFNNNYRFDYIGSEACEDNDQAGGCYIKYSFCPGKKYGKTSFDFFYSFTDDKIEIANNNVPIELPSCTKDKNHCDFKLSLKELVKIAKQENLQDQSIRLGFYNNEVVGVISYCNLYAEGGRRKIYVSLINGTVLWDGSNAECQGII